jgi:uncharacterized membrane protein (DUF2068 family)
MTPRDHSKTIGIAFGLIGLLMLAGLTVLVWQQLQQHAPAGCDSSLPWELYLLPLPLLHLLTSYGLFRRRRWARLLALIFCVLYVVIFPLGTALAVYIWVFMHSVDGRAYFDAGDST